MNSTARIFVAGASTMIGRAVVRLLEAQGFINLVGIDDCTSVDRFFAKTRPQYVVAALLRRMHEARLSDADSVEIWGAGSPRRKFIYVDDLADAMIFLVRHYEGVEPINVGAGVTTTIRKIAEMHRHVVGYTGELRFDNGRPDGMQLKGLDSTPLRHLGWTPTWDLRAALKQTYEFFQAHPETWEETAVSYGG